MNIKIACSLYISLLLLTTTAALAQTTLEDAAPFPFGAAVNVALLKSNTTYRAIASREYSSITGENAMKMDVIHPSQNTFDYKDADTLVNFAIANGNKRVHGHTLVWYNVPSWVTNFVGDSTAWENLLKTHIQTVVAHYAGKVTSWDVVNEALNDDGSLRSCIWLTKLGKGYISRSFQYAHDADPNALLFYNEYGHEYSSTKLAAIKHLVDSFVVAGIPIHGVGMQFHTVVSRKYSEVTSAIDSMVQTGLKVHLSELDIAVNPSANTSLVFSAALKQQQASLYKFIARYYKTKVPASQQYGITTWNIGDADSWIPQSNRPDWPCLFDSSYQKNTAYQGVIDGLSGSWKYVYGAETKAGVYTDLGSNGTAIATNFSGATLSGVDDNSSVQNIGFNFQFNGSTYSTFVLNTNGFIKFGSNAPSSGATRFSTSNASSGTSVLTSNDIDCVYPFNGYLKAGTAGAEYRMYTSGTTGTRVCTIQFKNLADNFGQFDNINFQVKLYEYDNTIEFIYGNWTALAATDNVITSPCGLKGINVDSSLNVRKGSADAWSAATFLKGNYIVNDSKFNTKKSVLPDAGRTYRFAIAAAGDYRSSGAGVTVNLNTITNWQVCTASGWTAATVAPATNVSSGNTITIQPADTWTNTTLVTIPAGVTLIHQGKTTTGFTANTFVINGTYIHYTANGSSTVGQVFSGINATTGLANTSTVIFRGSASFGTSQPSPVYSGRVFGNLTFDTDGSGTPTNNPAPGTDWTINGTLTISGWTLNMDNAASTALLTANGNVTLNSSASFTAKNATFNNNTITVNSGCTFSNTSGFTITTNSGSNLVVNAGGIVNINGRWINNSTNTFTQSGSLKLNSTGVYQHNVNGGTMPAFSTISNTSTIEVTGIASAANLVIIPSSCGNVVWNCPLQTTTNTFLTSAGAATTTLNGNLTVASTGTGSIYLKGASTTRVLNVAGNINLSGGTLKLVSSGGVGDQPCNVSGDVNVSGGTFTLSEATNATGRGLLNITGSLNHTAGVFGAASSGAAKTSVVTFTGNNTGKTISTTGIANGAVINIDKTASGNISLVSDVSFNAKATLNVVSGTLIVNGKTVRLSSDATSAAIIGTVTGSIDQSVAGSNFVVERYIPARRAWRLLTAPLSNSNSINTAWQNGGVYTPGIGTFITAPGGTNGLDDGAGYSLKAYNSSTQVLEPVTNTNVSMSASSGAADNKAYFIFVRGDRNPNNLTPPNTNATTLSASGLLQTGTQSFAAAATKDYYTSIGNPYASPVDFSLLSRSNVANKFYVWDPTLNTVGGYVLLDDMDNDGNYSVVPASSQTKILQQGQAFFVQTIADGSASLTFNESNKSSVINNGVFRTSGTASNVLSLSLQRKNSDDSYTMADGCQAEFNDAFSPAVTIEDGAKLFNINENISFERNSKLLALERRALPNANDTLFVKLSNTAAANYRLSINPSNFSGVVSAWLEDKYLNKITPISLTSSSNADFDINADAASADANRFMIIFRNNSTLPVVFSNIKASRKGEDINVDWSVATEENVKYYEVERSANGVQFEKMAQVQATGNRSITTNYSWLDSKAVEGNNYYRIKAVEQQGASKVSKVVLVKISSNSSIGVYPNPVKDHVMHIQMFNKQKGDYVVQVFNQQGQAVYTTTIQRDGTSNTFTLNIGQRVAKGSYRLVITGQSGRSSQNIFVE